MYNHYLDILNHKLTVLQAMVVESILYRTKSNDLGNHSFQKTMFYLMNSKCNIFEYESNENRAFRFYFRTPGKGRNFPHHIYANSLHVYYVYYAQISCIDTWHGCQEHPSDKRWENGAHVMLYKKESSWILDQIGRGIIWLVQNYLKFHNVVWLLILQNNFICNRYPNA